MTREEAIEVLNMVEAHGSLVIEAKNMAIKALEQETVSRESYESEYLARKQAELELWKIQQNTSDDCVSRQAVLDKIQSNWWSASLTEDAVKNLPSVTPTQKWISVSERLPKSSGVYIVSRWFSDGEESAILTDANYYDGNGYWYNDNRINWGRDLVTDKIVAWMPLPEPYKAEMESEE